MTKICRNVCETSIFFLIFRPNTAKSVVDLQPLHILQRYIYYDRYGQGLYERHLQLTIPPPIRTIYLLFYRPQRIPLHGADGMGVTRHLIVTGSQSTSRLLLEIIPSTRIEGFRKISSRFGIRKIKSTTKIDRYSGYGSLRRRSACIRPFRNAVRIRYGFEKGRKETTIGTRVLSFAFL